MDASSEVLGVRCSTSPCRDCRSGAASATWPQPVRIGQSGDGWAFLHKCDICGTYWEFNVREAHPISEEEARQSFPKVFDGD